VQLTPAGQKLAARSRNLIREWQDIRHELGQGGGESVLLRLGAPDVLWQARLLAITADFQKTRPHVNVELKTGGRRELASMLISDELDCVVLSEPLAHPGFESRRIASLPLLAVATAEISDDEAACFSRFVDIDWGDGFRNRLGESGLLTVAAVQINVAWLGLDWLLRSGGTAWLPRYLVQAHIEAGRLRLIPTPESIALDVYAAFRPEHQEVRAMLRMLADAAPGDEDTKRA